MIKASPSPTIASWKSRAGIVIVQLDYLASRTSVALIYATTYTDKVPQGTFSRASFSVAFSFFLIKRTYGVHCDSYCPYITNFKIYYLQALLKSREQIWGRVSPWLFNILHSSILNRSSIQFTFRNSSPANRKSILKQFTALNMLVCIIMTDF